MGHRTGKIGPSSGPRSAGTTRQCGPRLPRPETHRRRRATSPARRDTIPAPQEFVRSTWASDPQFGPAPRSRLILRSGCRAGVSQSESTPAEEHPRRSNQMNRRGAIPMAGGGSIPGRAHHLGPSPEILAEVRGRPPTTPTPRFMADTMCRPERLAHPVCHGHRSRRLICASTHDLPCLRRESSREVRPIARSSP